MSDNSIEDACLMREKRVYVCDIGNNHYFVASGNSNKVAYPNSSFDSAKWKYVHSIPKEKPVTELTLDEIANLLRKNNLINGDLKIKEK